MIWLTSIPLLFSYTLAQLNNSTIVGNANCLGYKLSKLHDHHSSIHGNLELIQPACNKYSTDLEKLNFQVTFTKRRIRVLIEDPEKKRYQVPKELLFPEDQKYSDHDSIRPLVDFKYEKNPFAFWITRKDTNKIVFDTRGHPLIFEDEYINLVSNLNKDSAIYGIGEVVDNFERDKSNTVQAMWARDAADPVRENVYGIQPFHIEYQNGRPNGAHMLNSYGMDVMLKNDTLQYHMLGGVIDLSIFIGKDYEEILDHYTATFGRPAEVPYWSLGFHQCRYGYPTIDAVKDVVQKYKESGLYLEAMWTDIEYMDMFKDFTLDPINYPLEKVQALVNDLHNLHQKYILIIDPAIARNETHSTYTKGKELDVFLKNPDNTTYIGQVWPGFSAFPDWTHPNTQKWWADEIHDFMDKVHVDGLWIDMNEPASFCAGSCGTNRTGIPPYPWLDPTYKPDVPQLFPEPNYKIHNFYGNLSVKTVSTQAKHYNGLTEFALHNLYGHMEAIATRQAMVEKAPTKRPFLLSRSTFTGSGNQVAHWLGDNASEWEYLGYSISGVLSFQLFGIPMVGADICGFNGNVTEELCLRWMQLGSFYPFARNHNGKGTISQEPYMWKSVLEASKKALHTRYSLLPLYSTLMHKSHVKGAPVWTPLPFEFPTDSNTRGIEHQFLLGTSLLVSPAVEAGATKVNAYFPNGLWYDWYDYSLVKGPTRKDLSAPLDGHVPLHLRGGHIVITQTPANTTHESRLNNYQLVIGLDKKETAQGFLRLDDGVTMDVPASKSSEIEFYSNHRYIKSRGRFNHDTTGIIESITIVGKLNYHNNLVILLDEKKVDVQIEYNEATKVLKIRGLKLSLNRPFFLRYG